MERSILSANGAGSACNRTWWKAARRLRYESLERRDLLAVTLAGSQAVGAWTMDIHNEVLNQTEARFTFSSSTEAAGTPYEIRWGDSVTVTRGVLDASSAATVSHTFARGNFTVRFNCGSELASWTFQSSSIALGHVSGTSNEAVFLVGNALANQVLVTMAGPSAVRIFVTGLSQQRMVPLTLPGPTPLTGIYGDLLAGDDTVMVQSTMTLATAFSLGDGNDTFTGGDGQDTVLGGAGVDRISGNGGNDVLRGGADIDWLSGGDGADAIDAGAGSDIVYGGAGDDLLFGNDGNDYIYGEAGNDLMEGDAGNDALMGGAGDDAIYGSAGDDVIDGGAGSDWLFGEQGRDRLNGGDGNDVVIGGAGADQVYGGAGNDILGGGYDFLLNLRQRNASLDAILSTWAVSGLVPAELSTTNLAIWDDLALDVLNDSIGRNLFYWDQGDTAVGRFVPGGDVKVTTNIPTATDVASVTYVRTGDTDPTTWLASATATTTLLGRWSLDTGPIIAAIQCRNTVDFGARPRSFQILNVPSAFEITNQFWADYNLGFLQQAVARNDVILATSGEPVPPTGGYGAEWLYLKGLGYTYDPATHRLLPTPV